MLDNHTYSSHPTITDDSGIEYPEEIRQLILDNVDSLSTVDSRHIASTYYLRKYFSEMALHKYRTKVEIIHFIKMAQDPNFAEVPELTEKQIFELYKIIEDFDKNEAIKVVEYDHFWRNWKWATEHDVKSIEYYLQEKFEELGLWDYKSFIHIYCTSEDINNIAYHAMLRDALNNIMLPKLRWILTRFSDITEQYKDASMMWRTHWQPASPTTFGKEIAVFTGRIVKNLERLNQLTLDIKFNGAVWNYNSHVLAKPNVDWIEYSEQLWEMFGFDVSLLTNQRWPMTENVALFQILQNLNRTLQDFCSDTWLYNKEGNVYHRKVKDEVGSSVMPQKVNPWFLEEAEWLLKSANDIFETFVRNNDVSRLQRDMTGHPHERNYGDAIWQTLTAWTNILESLSRIEFDEEFNTKQLENHAEVVTEWIQTVLRREKEDNAYEILKAIARWKHMSLEWLSDFVTYLSQAVWEKQSYPFIEDLDDNLKGIVASITLDESVIDDLKSITPTSFVWLAPKLADTGNRKLVDFMEEFDSKIATTTRDKVQAVLFDFDNTLQLWDKEELSSRIEIITDSLWLSVDDTDMQSITSLSDFREMKTIIQKLGETQWKELSLDDIQNANDAVTGNFDDKFFLDDWSKELIELLKRNNIAVGIVSTRWNQSLIRLINNIHNIWEDVDVIISRDDVEERKPSPEWINNALEKLDLDSANVFFVGDKFWEDVKWAQNAGVIPIYIERTDEWLCVGEKEGVTTLRNMQELYNYFYSKLV